MHRPTLATMLAAALTLGPLPVAAQSPGAVTLVPAQWGQSRAVQRDRYRRVYDQGYQAGRREAARDARSRRGNGDYRRHNDYRRGGPWNGNSAEANAYRQGFADGYRDVFSRNDRGWGSPYPSQRGYPGYPSAPGRTYPGYPNYPSSRGYPSYPQQGYPGGHYGYAPGADRGFDDGYREGQNAARRNERYDPRREKKYRDGDDGYNGRYGSRERYKQAYRTAFVEGYERGYREGRYYR